MVNKIKMNITKVSGISQSMNDLKITLVAVTKNHSIEEIQPLYQLGLRVFGENRVQELMSKVDAFPTDVQWHLIGHLQTNKVKYIAPFISLIHSVDSWELLSEIDKQAAKNSRIIDVLLQVHVAQEESKFGFSQSSFIEEVKEKDFLQWKNIRVCGIMGMASLVSDSVQIRQEFRNIKEMFDQLKPLFGPEFKEISMGMSGDYQTAIEEGSTMIRLGSILFES
jgi:pyridoxal phosphate enzyme (YggS family)